SGFLTGPAIVRRPCASTGSPGHSNRSAILARARGHAHLCDSTVGRTHASRRERSSRACALQRARCLALTDFLEAAPSAATAMLMAIVFAFTCTAHAAERVPALQAQLLAPLERAPLDTPLVVTGGFGEFRQGHFH